MRARLEDVIWPDNASFLVRSYELPAFTVPWHFHPEIELAFILEGEGNRCVGDHLGPFAAGDLVLLGANLPHYWRSHGSPVSAAPPAGTGGTGRARAIVVHLRESSFGPGFLDLPETASWKRLLEQSRRGLLFPSSVVQDVSGPLQALPGLQGGARLLGMLGVLQRLAAGLDKAAPLAGERYLPASGRRSQGRMGRVYEYLYHHLDQPLSLPVVAQVAGMSDAAFSRYCRKATGRTLTRLIGELRITQACRYLTDTGMGVAEIAFSSGFQSLSNFNRAFLEIKGLSPQAFRRRHREGIKSSGSPP